MNLKGLALIGLLCFLPAAFAADYSSAQKSYKSNYDNEKGFAGPGSTVRQLEEDDEEKTPSLRFEAFDEAFMASIATFRPISNREIEGQKPKTIHYVKATEATTFAALAAELKLDEAETDELRLINGHYPAGEPQPGDWIKIFKQ